MRHIWPSSDLITANPFLFEHLKLPLQLRLALILLLRSADKHGLAIELCAVHVLYGLITDEKWGFPANFKIQTSTRRKYQYLVSILVFLITNKSEASGFARWVRHDLHTERLP